MIVGSKLDANKELPRSVKLNKKLVVGGNSLLEVGLVQHKHVILNGDGGRNDRGNDEEKVDVDDGSHQLE